jgi:hypothetical protein
LISSSLPLDNLFVNEKIIVRQGWDMLLKVNSARIWIYLLIFGFFPRECDFFRWFLNVFPPTWTGFPQTPQITPQPERTPKKLS